MAEKVKIASLSIDYNDVIKKSTELAQKMQKIKTLQKEVDKTTAAGMNQYNMLNAELKNVSKSYRDNQAFAGALSEANKNLEKTLSSENKSTQELYDSRRQLNVIAKNIKGNSKQEVDLRNKITIAVDEQTAAIRSQSSDFVANKDSIGEYKKGILEAYAEMKKAKTELEKQEVALRESQKAVEEGSETWNFYQTQLNQVNIQINVLSEELGELNDETAAQSAVTKLLSGDLKGLAEDSKKAGGAGKLLKSGLRGAASGMKTLTISVLKFLLTPIGALLGLVVGLFLLMKNAMNKNAETLAKVKKAFAIFGSILNVVLKLLEPLGTFLIDVLLAAFQALEKGLFMIIEGIATALEFFGQDTAAAALRSFSNEIKEVTKASRDLIDAERELTKMQRTAQRIQLEYQKKAEKLRQIRDDDTKSMAVRIAANEQLGKVLKEQLKSELIIARKALEVANLRIKAEGKTKESLDGQEEALAKIADIEERITGQESEQLTNRVALLKEHEQKKNEARKKYLEAVKRRQDKQLKRMDEELELFIANEGVKAKTLKESLAFHDEIRRKERARLEKNLEFERITKTKFDAEMKKLENQNLLEKAVATVEYSKTVLSEYVRLNKSKLDSEKFLTEELYNEEKRRLELLAEQRREHEKTRLEEAVITQRQYNDKINEINEEDRLANKELDSERKEAKYEQRAEDFENELIIKQEENVAESEILGLKLEDQFQKEIQAAAKSGASVALIEKKYNLLRNKLSAATKEQQIKNYSDIAGNFKDVVGENTVVGKAAAIAQTTIDTYLGAQKAYSSQLVVGDPSSIFRATLAASFSVASGLANVAKITGISDKFEKGTILKGASHSQGGIPFSLDGMLGFEAEGGEALINKKSTKMFAPLLSRINEAGGGVAFAGGSILGSTALTNGSVSLIDYEMLKEMFIESIKELPKPVISLEQFAEARQDLDVVEQKSDF